MTLPALATCDRASVCDGPLPRIGLIAASLDVIGGHGVQVDALEQSLRRDGYEVSFIPINPRPPRALRWMRRLPLVRTALNQSLYIPSLRRLEHVDIVHVFSASYWSFLLAPVPAIVAARQLGKRVVLHYHSGEADDHLANWGIRVHPWLRRVDEIVVPSRYLARVFADHGYRARVIANVVDTSRFAYRARPRLAPSLLSNRNLERHYRVDVTLRAFARLKRRHPEATLTVAGSGSQGPALRALAADLGLDGVTFVGAVPPSEMPRLYAAADVFVNASEIDNQPVSLLEAFAAGVPVVSTGTGDITGMLENGRSGVVVPPDDPSAMADAVSGLLANPARALAMTERARQRLAQHTWGEVGAAWSSLYSSLGS